MKSIHYIIAMILCLIIGFLGGYFVFYKNSFDKQSTPIFIPEGIGGISSSIDSNVDATVILNSQLQWILDEQKNTDWEPELGQAFSNIKYALRNDAISDQHLNYYGVWNSLLFSSISQRDECDVYLEKISTPSPQRFYQECIFQYYLKKLLENKWNYDVPSVILAEYSILNSISNKSCSVENDFQCMLLFNNEMTREKFLSDMPQLMIDKWFTVSDFLRSISLVSYWIYVFNDDVRDIDTLEEALNLYYDEALIQKAVYENQSSYCDEINYEPSQKYCRDILNNDTQKYLELFNKFYSLSE